MYFEQLNPDNCKSYLLFNERTRSAVIIDPKLDYAELYLKRLEEKRAKLKLVIDTHTHSDHISGAIYLKEKTCCRYAMHERSENKGVDVKLKNNDVLDIDGITFKVIYTPGHTKDSICIAWQDRLFTGDILFLNKGIGRVDPVNSSVNEYWRSLLRIKDINNHFIVCPAHIYDDSAYSTIWLQKKNNNCLKLRSRKEFKEHMKLQKEESDSHMINRIIEKNLKGTMDIDATKLSKVSLLCQSEGEILQEECKVISCGEFKNKLNKRNIVILDVRSREEIAYEKSDIIGTINISVKDLCFNLYKLEEYVNKEMIIICRNGRKSQEAYTLLNKSGFKNICIVQGGLNQFKEIYGE